MMTFVLPLKGPDLAVIVAMPADTAVTNPEAASTLATAELDDIQTIGATAPGNTPACATPPRSTRLAVSVCV